MEAHGHARSGDERQTTLALGEAACPWTATPRRRMPSTGSLAGTMISEISERGLVAALLVGIVAVLGAAWLLDLIW